MKFIYQKKPHSLARTLALGLALAACLFLCLSKQARAASPELPQLKNVKRIVFLGDSITQAGDYVTDVDCWLLSRSQDVEVLNLGLGSETASDLTKEENADHLKKFGFGRPFLSERLSRLLSAAKPDLVFACYGMNDGSSLPAGEIGTKRYTEAVTRLRESILKSGAKQVVLVTPPVRESNADAWPQNLQDQNLTRYTDWLLSMKAKGWSVVDVHTPMRLALDAERVKNPNFNFTKDSVHPGREGHWVMATCILQQYFGAKLDSMTGAEQFFPEKGAEIRKLVSERMKTRFDAWMSKIGHKRPGVPGGPGIKPGLSVKDATLKADEITKAIQVLLLSDGQVTRRSVKGAPQP